MIISEFLGRRLASNSSKVLLSNGDGGFFFFSPTSFSKYQGLFFREGADIFKGIEEIRLLASPQLRNIHYKLQGFTNEYDDLLEEYVFPVGKNALLYENYSNEVAIILDSRKIDDLASWGRYYEIHVEGEFIVIRYSKTNDSRESSSGEYSLYTVIKADSTDFKQLSSWEEKNYAFDHSRNDLSSRHVYKALSLKSSKIGFGFSKDKEVAMQLALETYRRSELIKTQMKESRFDRLTIGDLDLEYAYALSTHALRALEVDNLGVYAGLPWFHQFWTRDTAISSKALVSIGKKELVKNILSSLLHSSGKDGLIPNRYPHSDLPSIDGTGLVISRLQLVMDLFDKNELKDIKAKIRDIALAIESFRSKDGLVNSNPYESWMDTDIRSGALIEVQALQLAIYASLRKFAKAAGDKKTNDVFAKVEKEFKAKVIAHFFKNDDLIDSESSRIRRPNVFLAYYFYPELLKKDQWIKIFDKHLQSLYLEWGGLSTIDTSSQYFVPNHAGVSNASYHRGDSWFFLNNMTAICLARLDRRRYHKHIDQILNASTRDILHEGIFGFHSEISSASHQEATGCLAQLWSSAMYIELIEELYKKN